ncbi:MAG TPA: hypothetical protein VEF53_06055 [Patescibacteria group bacterium]|nr:hypothetical protein [Patescibacteria group bacterium]
MPSYEEVRSEMREIADILKLFPEALQDKVFDILISEYLGVKIENREQSDKQDTRVEDIQIVNLEKEQAKTPAGGNQKRKNISKESYQIVKELNLKPTDGKPSFEEFCKSKAPRTNIEFNTVAVYYLSKMLELPAVTIDHVYTCYKEFSKPVPGNLKQSIFDTSSSKYGYINSRENTLTIPVRGENFVEHDLPKKGKD